MYQPVQHGIQKELKLVNYIEAKPPKDMRDLVHCYWRLHTLQPLSEEFHYHVLPDACIDIVFDFSEPESVTVMTPGTRSEVLSLGKEFSYVGIRLLPGVWNMDLPDIIGGYKKYSALGDCSIEELTEKLESKSFAEQQDYLTVLVKRLHECNILQPERAIQSVLLNLNMIKKVADMTQFTNISSRQLQRRIKNSTGFTPHDFLKILRLQQSFEDDYLSLYTDQPHFIHSFQKITHYTPKKYKNTFDV